MPRLLSASIAIFTLLTFSGCCEIFGICTSVSVHSSLSSPQKFARANILPAGNAGRLALADTPLQNETGAGDCTADAP